MKSKTFKKLQVGDVVRVRTFKEVLELKGVKLLEPWDDALQICDTKSKMPFEPWIPLLDAEFYGRKFVVAEIGASYDTVRLDGKKLGYALVVRKMLAEELL